MRKALASFIALLCLSQKGMVINMQNKEISSVLTVATAAKLYANTALTASGIRRLVRSGEIASRKIGNRYLITAIAIENWLHNTPASAPEQGELGHGHIRRVDE